MTLRGNPVKYALLHTIRHCHTRRSCPFKNARSRHVRLLYLSEVPPSSPLSESFLQPLQATQKKLCLLRSEAPSLSTLRNLRRQLFSPQNLLLPPSRSPSPRRHPKSRIFSNAAR